VLQGHGIKGNKAIAWNTPGLAEELNVTDRATICNMAPRPALPFSIFPSDDITKAYLEGRKRANDFKPLAADAGRNYSRTVEIDLSSLSPRLRFYPASEVDGGPSPSMPAVPVDTVFIGSCTTPTTNNLARVGECCAARRSRLIPRSRLFANPFARQLSAAGYMEVFFRRCAHPGKRLLRCIGQGFSPPAMA